MFLNLDFSKIQKLTLPKVYNEDEIEKKTQNNYNANNITEEEEEEEEEEEIDQSDDDYWFSKIHDEIRSSFDSAFSSNKFSSEIYSWNHPLD